MIYMLLGLVLFLGVHSVRIVADDWRTGFIAAKGENAYKGLYSVVSLVGFVLLIWGFSVARETPVLLWVPPVGMRHLASLLTLIAFILLAAAYVPRNGIKARLRHPMVLGVKTWALAHLLANGMLSHVVLFGAFLVWSVFSFRAARQRDRAAGLEYVPGAMPATIATVVVGAVAWAVFALWLHGLLIGIKPFG